MSLSTNYDMTIFIKELVNEVGMTSTIMLIVYIAITATLLIGIYIFLPPSKEASKVIRAIGNRQPADSY